jgi:FKBP-type peptidyl-prolyl cis-trans isomerase FkpA
MIRRLGMAVAVLACFALALNAGDDHKPAKDVKIVKTDSGLQYQDLKVGKGDAAKTGDTVEVHYTGWLAKDGKKFDSSKDSDKPFPFKIGGRVIKGWNEGVVGMKPGGKRKLIIPAKLAYGEDGYPDVIPPNADLVFDVELIKIK